MQALQVHVLDTRCDFVYCGVVLTTYILYIHIHIHVRVHVYVHVYDSLHVHCVVLLYNVHVQCNGALHTMQFVHVHQCTPPL